MANIERGIVIREITVKRPSGDMVGAIIRAQAELRNRLVQVEWKNADGGILKVIIDPRGDPVLFRKNKDCLVQSSTGLLD